MAYSFAMNKRVPFEELNWDSKPGRQEVIVTRQHHSGEMIEIPVAVITGAQPGPTFTVMSGMHAGEYSGILAAQRLVQAIRPDALKGRLIVIPVISTRAFMERNMQLNPVDQKELHFQRPGTPDGTYSECLADTLFSLVSGSSYLIDSHAGEIAQALYPWVPIPMVGPKLVQESSYNLALGFDVPYIEPRYEPATIPAFCLSLIEAGVANIWVEVGKQGVPTEKDTRIHYDGTIAALRTVGMLEGAPSRPAQKVLKGRGKQINSSQSGIFHPAIKEGDVVEPGQLLGRLTDYFGNVIAEYHAEKKSLILYYWSSPAINAERTPHGYNWHNGLIRLIELED
ncbi:MAG: succinylglutamate desuccinylase/aspartoacylase family protein [Chloroflexi bacterium]|nr:succinylglutamate desuccinylase/aspartoacylase family protein [Chloroflexota bacterium]